MENTTDNQVEQYDSQTMNPIVDMNEEATANDKNDGLQSLSYYNRELSKNLPKEIFKQDPARLKWGVFFLLSNIAIVIAIMNFSMPWPVKLLLSVVMGNFLGGMAFLSHETLHGSITKNPKLQNIIGFIGFGPFLISPTFWKFWHNRLHHGNTQLLYKDPDAFPTKMVWKRSKFMQWAFPLTPGSGHKRSYFYFFYWFSFQAFLNQIQMRFGNKMWDKMDHKKVTLEFALLCAAALCYVGIVGVENWLWLVILPFMI